MTRQSPAGRVLTYGTEPRLRHWRRWVGGGLVILVLLALAWLGVRLYRPYRAQASHLRAQERLSHQVLPAGTVLYTEDPARVAALRGQGGYRDVREPKEVGRQEPAVIPEALERVHVTHGFSLAPIVLQNGQTIQPNTQVRDTFGYERVSEGGQHWIVFLSGASRWAADGGRRKVGLTQAEVRPVGWKPGARGQWVSYASKDVLLEPTDVFTLFAPQPDPHDASRIDVPYELNGQPGVLDGEVQDSGRVVFSVSAGPARME